MFPSLNRHTTSTFDQSDSIKSLESGSVSKVRYSQVCEYKLPGYLLISIKAYSKVMEVATIFSIVVLNILLPTADVVTDINLAVRLDTPLPRCKFYNHWDGDRLQRIYLECEKDPVTFCSKRENSVSKE